MSAIVQGTSKTLRVLLAGICALVLTVGLARFAYTPMLPIMHREAGLDDLAGGWLAAFNYLGYMTGAFIASLTRDLSRKFHYYRIGLVLAVVSTVAMGLVENPVVWAVLRFISGLSSVAGLLLASGLILNWMVREKARPELGIHFAGMGTGIMISGLFVALLALWCSWSGVWMGLGLLGILFMVPAWMWMPKPQMLASGAAAKPHTTPPRRWMIAMMAGYFCAGFGYVISATFIVAIVEHVPALAGWGALVWIVVGLAALPSTFFWDRIARRMGNIPTLVLCYILQIVSFILPVANDGVFSNLASAVLYGGTFVGIVSLTLTLIGRCFPDNPAKAMAKLTLSYGAAQIVAPAMAGYIAAASGSYAGALVAAGVVMGAGIICLIAAGEQRAA